MRWSFFGGKPMLANSQEYFNNWIIAKEDEKKRLPKGRINYYKINDIVFIIPYLQ